MARTLKPALPGRYFLLDAMRGWAVLWMTAFHFCFDLNYFGFIHQDFHTSPVWFVQRTCILSLFLLCAGFGQAMAVHAGQSWNRFWRRWLQIAGCAAAVSVGSALMFPNSWIYFGVLHGMAVMLLLCRATASWGRWLWPAGLLVVALGYFAPQIHTMFNLTDVWNQAPLNCLGLVRYKPFTEDYVPLLPWLGVMWWGMAAGQMAAARGWIKRLTLSQPAAPLRPLAWMGRWSLSWYMVHQPVMIGVLTAVGYLR